MGVTSAPPLLTRLGSYELIRLVAQGGMADIYLARHAAAPDRHLAVKVLNGQRAEDAEARALFLDEARLLAMMSHPCLAAVSEVAVEGGVHYFAMEFVHGVDLRGLLAAAAKASRAIPYESAVAIVAAAAGGLDHAHRRCGPDGKPLQLVHRDVSLSNIMVGHDGSVKVVDFGIATATVSSHLTNPGIVRGKASYMSPEQCLGDPVDLRTDVFALGVVLYELTTGRRCFQGASDFERMLAVVRGEYVPPAAHVPEYPGDLAGVVTRALAIDPAQRFASAAALVEALDAVVAAHGWQSGAAATRALMLDLFGDVTEPWVAMAALVNEDTFVGDASGEIILPKADPTVVVTKPRRIARGTEAEPRTDDEPTRGRRSAPRLWGGKPTSPVAA